MNELVRALAHAVDSELPRDARGRAAAEIVRNSRGYRWVGIYDVGDEEAALIAQSGATPLANELLNFDQGLSGEAMRTRATVTAGSLVIVPILGAESGIVIGTLDVESDRPGAFAGEDVDFLEDCAAALRPLYD